MGLNPNFVLLANSKDVTAAIDDRFMSLRLTDQSGLDSDVLEITLADNVPERPIAIPKKGAELELWLGYGSALARMGMYVCDEIELAGDPGEMTIRARAATYEATPKGKTDMQTQKTRAWKKGTTLGGMVRQVAKDHGMEAAIAQALDKIPLPHIAQSDESDLNLLLRVARKYDATVKPSGGKLVLAKRGESKSISGAALPVVRVQRADSVEWRVVMSSRETAGTVVAYWHAVKQARRNAIQVGSGEPVRRLKLYYPTEEMALAAARAELAKRERNQETLALSLEGRTDLAAESRLVMDGFRDGVSGEWIITRVVHSLDGSGYRCQVEAEKPSTRLDDQMGAKE